MKPLFEFKTKKSLSDFVLYDWNGTDLIRIFPKSKLSNKYYVEVVKE